MHLSQKAGPLFHYDTLAQQRFKEALNLVRRHRIDFNVLVDLYGWQAFLHSAIEFVEQVNNLNHVIEFVWAMKNEDVTEIPYTKNSFSKKEDKVLQVKDHCRNKVSSVLQAIRKALEEHIPESTSRELCILTTLARSDPPAIEESILRIKFVREMELQSSSDDSRKKSCPSAEETLKHLLWLVDSEAVFEAALGRYYLNLAAIVVLNSQRDPKEFLPYLQDSRKKTSKTLAMLQTSISSIYDRLKEKVYYYLNASGEEMKIASFAHCLIVKTEGYRTELINALGNSQCCINEEFYGSELTSYNELIAMGVGHDSTRASELFASHIYTHLKTDANS